jgi:hypothetical protein
MKEVGLFEDTGFLVKIEDRPKGAIRLYEDAKFDFLTHARAALDFSQKNRVEVYWFYMGKKISTREARTVKDLLKYRGRIIGKKISRRYQGGFFCPHRYQNPNCAKCVFHSSCKTSETVFKN